MKLSTTKGRIIYGAGFAAIAILIIYRCFYGFGISFADEFAQPASVMRYFFGDRLLIDDWHPPTTLLGFFIYKLISFLPAFDFTVLQLRLFYVCFQIVVALLFLFLLGADKTSSKLCALAYLCSNPYGIMSISYNTVSIAAFLVFIALFSGDYKRVRCFFSGIALAVAVLAIPHLALVFILYALVVFVKALRKRQDEIFSRDRLKWLFAGILVLFIPFCIHLAVSGTPTEYINNLKFILGDPEHSGDSLLHKFVMSQFQMVRVYWRAWLPLVLLDIAAFFLRKNREKRILFYILGCVIVIYATIRFAFIYGSVSINLMIPPMFFLGLQFVALALIWRLPLKDYRFELLWLLSGYIFAICDFLATNTEILSMSAMTIVSALAAVALNYKLVTREFKGELKGTFAFYAVFAVFMVALLYLRMTYVWGDDTVFGYDTKIESGIAKGIYTTAEKAEEYNRMQTAIEKADIGAGDKVLFIPANPLYYLIANAEVSTPYIMRFNAEVSEFQSYYGLHDYKLPTRVVIHRQYYDAGNEKELIDYFLSLGYGYVIDDNDICVLESGRQ